MSCSAIQLNTSHHIDFHEWCCGNSSRPISIVATASLGVASKVLGIPCEDTITLLVQWENFLASSSDVGTAVYTSSWIAPKSDVHSQQRFFYMGQKGEIMIDQAHRGYLILCPRIIFKYYTLLIIKECYHTCIFSYNLRFTMSSDDDGFGNVNPLFMKYTPSVNGEFVGQGGYGYRSLELFVDAVKEIQLGIKCPSDFDESLASLASTFRTTAVLEAGRRSLDSGGKKVVILYSDPANISRPTSLKFEE